EAERDRREGDRRPARGAPADLPGQDERPPRRRDARVARPPDPRGPRPPGVHPDAARGQARPGPRALEARMKPLRLGVVGVGHRGQRPARVLAGVPGVELVGVADARIEQAEAVAARCATSAFADYRDLLGLVDAVSVAVPTTLHREVAGAFLERGVPAMVE